MFFSFVFLHCDPAGLIFISSRSRASSVTSRHVYSSLPFAARYHGYDKFLFVIEAERDCSFEFGLEKYRGSNDAANETCVRGERELRKSAVEIAPNHPPDREKNFPLLLWGS